MFFNVKGRFDFSGGKGLVRPNKNQIASTTLEIMRGQGLKYVHAITDGRQGVEGDLEKSKRKIKRYNETVRAFPPPPPWLPPLRCQDLEAFLHVQ